MKLRNRDYNTENPNMSLDGDRTLGAGAGGGSDLNNFSFGSGETRVAGFENDNVVFQDTNRGANKKRQRNSQNPNDRPPNPPNLLNPPNPPNPPNPVTQEVPKNLEEMMRNLFIQTQRQTLVMVQDQVRHMLDEFAFENNVGRGPMQNQNDDGNRRGQYRYSFPASNQGPNYNNQRGSRASLNVPQHQGYNPNNHRANSPVNHNVGVEKVKLYEWGFKYDGSDKLTVEDFLFRVQMAQQSSPYSWDQVYNYFHQILDGTMVNWYWQYRKQNCRGNFTMMKARLLEEYGSKDTDIDVWKAMMKRTQRAGENFMNFYRDMDDLHSRLSARKSDKEMIDLLKCNVRDELALAVAPFKTNSLSEFRNLCRDVDDVILRRNLAAQNRGTFRRTVHEISQDHEDEDGEVEAFNTSRNFKKRDQSQYVCFNCEEKGHGFRDCPSEKRFLFCYRCGEKNVTSPNCPVCQENRK